MPIGAHMSIAGGVHNAPGRAAAVGCECLQIFTRSNVRWQSPPLNQNDADAFREASAHNNMQATIGHSCYLINLAGDKEEIRKKSYGTLLDEVRRCAMLGITNHVIHPGSNPAGADTAITLICEALNRIFEETPGLPVRILLETTAGQGKQVGRSFEELRRMLDGVRFPDRVGVCVDTSHIFAAGYDIRTPEAYEKTFCDFEKIVGLQHIRAFHLNDSKVALGKRVDRHQHIGHGEIGQEAFRLIVNDARFAALPKIIETPKEDDWDVTNISLLKNLRQIQKA